MLNLVEQRDHQNAECQARDAPKAEIVGDAESAEVQQCGRHVDCIRRFTT